MISKTLVSTLAIAVTAGALAQPSRISWSRTSGSPGVNMDTARSGLINAGGKFVIAGSVNPVGLPSLGSVAVIDRRTATGIQNTFASPLGGPLAFFKVLEHQGHYFVFGTTRTAAANTEQIYMAKLDLALNVVIQRVFPANTYSGWEKPTDADVDANGNIYITGVAKKNNIWQMFVAKTDATLIPLNTTFPKLDITTYNEPQVTLNGIIAILIGLAANPGPVVRSYNPSGALMTQYTLPVSATAVDVRLADEVVGGLAYFAASWTEQASPGVFESHGAAIALSSAGLVPAHRFDLPNEPGNQTLTVTDIRLSSNVNRGVNTMFQRSGHAALRSMTPVLTPTLLWTDPLIGTLPSIASVTSWGDVVATLSRGTNIVNAYGLAVNNLPRFSMMTPAYNMLLPFMEQENLFHPSSGDILNIRTDTDRMQITCIQQAPVAVTNSYMPKSGVLYRPTLPVTANDRFAEGAAISIIQQPAHGVVTIGTNGYFNYTSASGYTGPDSFRYQLTKPGLTPSAATVNLTVTP